ncbi:MAG: VWA domain-containing protein [Pyrinomonadaceae bacterium]|nr:VWA domain-containing protein [Pyrinomonadaceae bacterium]
MYRFVGIIVFSVCVLVPAGINAQETTPTPPELEPEVVFTEEIKVNVAAFDRNGTFVKDVQVEDLVIVEDGRLHQPNSVRRIPANVLIVLDTGGELRQVKNFTQTRETAKELIQKLKPDSNVAVIEYHDKARILTDWTKSRKALLDDLDRKLIFGRRSIFSDALELAAAVLDKEGMENRHLVLISDGTDSLWSDERREAAMLELLRSNISVHVISYTRMELVDIEPRTKGVSKPKNQKTLPQEVIDTLPNGVRDVANAPKSATVSTDRKFVNTMKARKEALQKGEEFLLTLSENSSGLFILPDDKDEMIEKTLLVSRAIDSNYVVTYTPKRALTESTPGETRVIEVSSKKPGLYVQAKRKLVVGTKAEVGVQ